MSARLVVAAVGLVAIIRAAVPVSIAVWWLAPRPALAWETVVPWFDWSMFFIAGIGFDRSGNVIVAASADDVVESSSRIVALDKNDGIVRWTFDLPDDGTGGENLIYDIAVDRRGDVVIVGRDHGMEDGGLEDGFEGYFTVIKLDGETGAVRWHPDLGVGRAQSVVLDDAGDAFVAGGSSDGSGLRKISGRDGRLVWGAATGAFGLVTDALGDLFASGSGSVVKIDGGDGREIWRIPLSYAVAGRIRGKNVLATGCTAEMSYVVVLRGDDGSELWRRTFPTGRYSCALALHATVFRGRDVVIAAAIDSDAHVARLDGRTGATRWQRVVPSPEGPASVSHLVAGRSDVVVHCNGELLRLAPVTGFETYRRFGSGDPHDGIAVSTRGTVVFARKAPREAIADGFEVQTLSRNLVRRSGQPARATGDGQP